MNFDESTLENLAQRWQSVPYAQDIQAAAQRLLESFPVKHTHAGFNQLLVETAMALLAACRQMESDQRLLLARAQNWLTELGVLEELHVSYVAADMHAAEHIVLALRDACLSQVQRDYRRSLLARIGFFERVKMIEVWLATADVASVPEKSAWELADCFGDVLDSVGAGERLIEQLDSHQKK